ncbi:MAG: modA [Herbinix sp.]|jgi:molybdate transport system substrate-binding protein|nr:modA [Herbinix sp.]
MKHHFMFLLVVLLSVLLIGCSEKQSAKDKPEATPTTVTKEADPTAAVTLTQAAPTTPPEPEQIADTEVYVFIAASLSNVMEDIAVKYNETQPNVKITYNADSSGTLQTQIEEGAECDIFFSAATKQMTTLQEEGYVTAESIVNLLENKVVLIKPTGTETKVTGFENIFEAKSLALAAESVPVGDYARQIFQNLGIWDKVQELEINEGSNVTAVLSAVSEASNEVGVVYETDARSMKDLVEVITAAPEGSLSSHVIYPVGRVINPEADDIQQKAADNFIKFLSSDIAIALFEEYGFTVASE